MFVNALTDPASSPQQFTAMLRDFLVSLKEFSSQVATSVCWRRAGSVCSHARRRRRQDNSDLFIEEREEARASFADFCC